VISESPESRGRRDSYTLGQSLGQAGRKRSPSPWLALWYFSASRIANDRRGKGPTGQAAFGGLSAKLSTSHDALGLDWALKSAVYRTAGLQSWGRDRRTLRWRFVIGAYFIWARKPLRTGGWRDGS
jgi:hypothetical protein